MKLEYLAIGSPDCPLLRLYDFTAAEVGQLVAALNDMASGVLDRIEVHRLPGVELVAGCQLTLGAQRWDQGIIVLAGAANFQCRLTVGTWENIAGLLEPFVCGGGGFQWLVGVSGASGCIRRWVIRRLPNLRPRSTREADGAPKRMQRQRRDGRRRRNPKRSGEGKVAPRKGMPLVLQR